MSLAIVSNRAADVAHRHLAMNDMAATFSLAKLSSGSRVVAAKDDAAALAIGMRLSAEVGGLKQASINAGQAISMMQIADGALGKISDILNRMKSLSVQAGSDQLSSTERGFLDTEYVQLRSEIDRIASDTEFNGNALLVGSSAVTITTGSGGSANVGIDDGLGLAKFGNSHSVATTAETYTIVYATTSNKFAVKKGTTAQASAAVTSAPAVGSTTDVYFSEFDLTLTLNSYFDPGTAITSSNTLDATASAANTISFTFKVGTGTTAAKDEIAVTLNKATSTALGAATSTTFDSGDLTTKGNTDTASAAVSSVIDKVNDYRATVGANQNRLEFASANLATAIENSEAARSALLDLDVAQEMSVFTGKQILVQAGVSMLAQANLLPQNLLRLFG